MASRELPVSVALAALSATVALAFGGIFASNAYVGPLVGAALLPHALGWVTRRWTRSTVRGAAITAVGFLVYAAGLVGTPGPATVSRLVDRLQAGVSVVQSDSVPLRATDGAVLLAVLVIWLMAGVADHLAFHERMSVGALAPATMTVIWVRAFAPHGWVPSTVGFGVAAVVFLALQQQVLVGQGRIRVGRHAGGLVARRLATAIGVGLIAVLVGAAVAPALTGDPLVTDLVTGGGDPGSYQSPAPLVSIGAHITQGPREVLFSVKASQPDYWRLNTLDTYSTVGGGQWTLNATGSGAVGHGLSGPVPAGALHETFRIFGLGERWMPAAFEAVKVSRSDTLVVRSSATLVTDQRSVSGLTYTVDSRIPAVPVTPAQHAAAAADVPPSLRRFVALPASVPADVRATALRVVAGRANPYDRALALRDFFRTGFTYDQNVNLGEDAGAMSRFLVERRGACQQFATTYAVMARLVGIPARVATGFIAGTPDRSGAYQVSNHEAHAWPEVWLAGTGWSHLFDPTPRGELPGESALPQEPPVAGARTPTATPVPTTTPATPSPPGSPGSPTGGGVGAPSRAPSRGATVTSGGTGSGGSANPLLLLLGALIIVGTALVLAVVLTRRARRRARRRSASEPRALIAGAWAEVLDELREAGIAWPVSLTPLEVAFGLSGRADPRIGAPLTSLAGAYTAARYGDVAPPSGSGEAAWRDADAVLRALDASLDFRTRLRAHLATERRDGQPEPAGWSLPRRRFTKV